MIDRKFAEDYLAEMGKVIDLLDAVNPAAFGAAESFIRKYVMQVDDYIANDMLKRCAELRKKHNAAPDKWHLYDLLTMLKNSHTHYIWPDIQAELNRR